MPSKSNTSNFSPSFLRWAGSKRQLIPILSEHWNSNFERYVEPFVGSACLFFSLAPKKALLGDINNELIITYKALSRNSEKVLRELSKLNKSKDDYYKIRNLDSETMSEEKRAARFIYLNRYCFNGLYRTNSKGKFNVPYCGDDKGVMPPDELFENASKLLKRASLTTGDFENTLKKVKKGDFVYMDPPFSVRSSRIFNKYDKSIFGLSDIMRLRKWIEHFDKQGIKFVVSYAESDEAKLLGKGFKHKKVSVRRSIAGFTKSRRNVNEMIIYN